MQLGYLYMGFSAVCQQSWLSCMQCLLLSASLTMMEVAPPFCPYRLNCRPGGRKSRSTPAFKPIHVFTITDNSQFHGNQSTNEGAIQVTTYPKKITKSPSKKVIHLTDFSENQSHPYFTTLCTTDNFPKFRVYPLTNVHVGAIQATTYYDTN
jgi:hypothetical protein